MECRKLRRAFHLCNIPDSYHSKIFIYSAVNSFEKLSSYNSNVWTKLLTRAQKWPQSIFLSSFQVDKLTAISRWVLVKIIYGVDINVDELSKDDVSRIVTEEICEDADPVE